MPIVTVAGRKLAYEWLDADEPGRPTLVFLHEGLGSMRQWGEFPLKLVKATGCRALVYDRYGYGQSEVLAEPRRGVRFMHEEALTFLPGLLEALRVEAPILVGHSDGGSIALIYAGAGNPLRGLAVMAPHVFVETVCIRSIEAAKRQFETGELEKGLAKYHRDARRTFYLWNDVWLDPAFLEWNIEEYLPGIRCPVLALQGHEDRYGTMAQIDAVARAVRGPCRLVKLEGCGHSPHREAPEAALEALGAFVGELATARA